MPAFARMVALWSEYPSRVSDDELPTTFDIQVPDDLIGGAYANFLSVWHSGHEFTLDFSSTQPPQPRFDDSGNLVGVTVPSRVTARVKIPPTLVFDIVRALNANMTKYEEQFGSIRRPGQEEALFPPDDLLSSNPPPPPPSDTPPDSEPQDESGSDK